MTCLSRPMAPWRWGDREIVLGCNEQEKILKLCRRPRYLFFIPQSYPHEAPQDLSNLFSKSSGNRRGMGAQTQFRAPPFLPHSSSLCMLPLHAEKCATPPLLFFLCRKVWSYKDVMESRKLSFTRRTRGQI